MSSDSVTRECITKSNRAGSYGVTVGPGDIILFSRNCYRMNPFPALLCYCAKIGAWSHWDHVGIVVPYEEKTNSGPDAISSKTQRLGLLEINIGGVTLRPLTERILRSSSHRIAVRQLVAPPGSGRIERDAMNKRLADAASRLMKMQYNDSKLALSNSMLQSHWSHAQRNRAALLDMASIDRDMSDLAAELAAHGITCTDDKIGAAAAMCKIDDRGATAPLLQLWANDHMQSLLEHRRIDKKAVEAHYLIHEVAATSQRAGENYFCSDLVADVLHDCGVLHAAVRDRTHMLLPADLSSTAVVAGVSLYMNSNSNNKNYNVTKNCQHYKMTPDIEFVKKGLRMTENADGTVFLESSTSLRSESAEAENASALVCIKFAPGDVLPLHWLKGAMAPSSEKSKEIFTVTIQEGSVELLTPGYSYIGEPVHQCEVHHSAHEAHGLFRVARLSAKPNQISTLRYARDGSFPFEFDLDKCSDWVHQHSITNGGDDVDPAYSSTGWFLVNVNEEKSWVWSCSRNCRLRAGRDGAVLTIRIDNFSNLHLVGGVSSLSDASNCKISALDENAGIEALEAAVRLLLPHPSVVSPHSSRSDKNLCNELVRSIRRHASVLTISPPTVDSSG